ncbi:MAG: sigma factor, partial [Bacteroidota bacterium]
MPYPITRNAAVATFSPSTSDESLLAQIQGGDRKAFERLFHRYYKSLCHHANGLIQCQYRAEEIVSDVFVKVWKNRAKIQIST